MYALGLDIGSSSVKGAVVHLETGRIEATAHFPDREMRMLSKQPGWAEQHPEDWWEAVCQVINQLLESSTVDPGQIESVGIAYQMHGLVLIDEQHNVLRPAIIWCDSRAVEIGEQAFRELGEEYCLTHLLNSPGNFTASKLKWVLDNEPDVYARTRHLLLPGDFIAMKFTGEAAITVQGLSECILWDFVEDAVAQPVLDYFGIEASLIPPTMASLGPQGRLTAKAAEDTGLEKGTPVSYRAGDQPNNALTLGVFEPNEVAATGGTSGVIYGVMDKPVCDRESRVNGFAHVNHSANLSRIGQLLCINGAGILYSWIRDMIIPHNMTYEQMEAMASSVSPGSEGVVVLPFGNGAERVLGNIDLGAQLRHIRFNQHEKGHLVRASLEGIASAFRYGYGVLTETGLQPGRIRVGNDNLFRSQIFSETVATLLEVPIEICQTTGAAGAALASALGNGRFASQEDIRERVNVMKTVEPLRDESGVYTQLYQLWLSELTGSLNDAGQPSSST